MGKALDLIGQRFGRLLVTSFSHTGKGYKKYWNCKCDCGNTTTVLQDQLRRGKTKSCGCLRGRPPDLEMVGMRFGKLTVISFSHINNWRKFCWLCKCDCGKECIVVGVDLRLGHTKSCGCIKENQADKIIGRTFGRLYVERFDYRDSRGNSYYFCVCACGNEAIVRGTELYSGGTKSCGCYAEDRSLLIREYNEENALIKSREALYALKIRCFNKESKMYKDYGGRGITVCARWMDKKEGTNNFIRDMGMPPTLMHQIDRTDNNGNYEPENCRWVSSKINNRNRRNNRLIEFEGRVQCAAAWIEESGMKPTTFFSRLSRGWTEEEALTIPAGERRKNV